MKGSILRQVSILFALGILAVGLITSVSQYRVSNTVVRQQMEIVADTIADEVKMAIREYPAYPWLIRYWYEHDDELDIEYDADFGPGTATEQKCRILGERYPGLQLKYADSEDIEAMSEEDRKLYAEVIYSWIITRLNEIKRAYSVSFLFCVLTDQYYASQYFLLSAADPGAVRGTDYEQVYTLGTTVDVTESQQMAMRGSQMKNEHLADAGSYMDYYSYFGFVNGKNVLIGITYDLSGLQANVRRQALQNSAIAMAYQILLSLLTLGLIAWFVLHPLKKVQKNIRLYKNTKDSSHVVENLAAVRPDNEIGQLSQDVSELAMEIDDYLKRIETITAERERIGTELSLATRIQEDMLPNVFPAFPDRSDFDVYATMTPAKEVGGDFYDFFLIDDDHLGLVIADVSGKGIPAALFMMVSKILVQNTAMTGFSPAEVLRAVNEQICANNREEMFVTVWFGILEISTGKITAANAGHEYPVLMLSGGQFELIKDKHGFVIGGMEGLRYKEYELQLTPGSRLFVYTDGVPEATDAEGKMFGTERMLAALNEVHEETPETIIRHVRSAVDGFVKDAEQFDDLTMLCLEYRGA